MATCTTTLITDDTLDNQDLVAAEEDDDSPLAALTPKQHQVIALLTQGQSVSAVARTLGLHRTTIHHWRRTEPTFALALRDAERDTAQDWRCATQARAEKALTALDRLLDDECTPATVRLKAVLHVLNTATALPPSIDMLEQDLLTREKQRHTRERGRVIDQILDDAEAQQNMSHEEYRAMLFEGETDEERAEYAHLYPHRNSRPASEDADEGYEEAESTPAAALIPTRHPGIHHNSSLLPESRPVELFATPKTVVYATPKPGRNERCPCQSGRKYKHCCLDKDNQRIKSGTESYGPFREISSEAQVLVD